MDKVKEFIENPNWHHEDVLREFFNWATSLDIEESGIARRQLGYYDGYSGEQPSSNNSDYLEGFNNGRAMRTGEV